MSAPSDLDWSAGAWERTCRTRLVRQQHETDCGVSCLAMIEGISYQEAVKTLNGLGLAKAPRPLSSNFTEFKAALREHGLAGRMLRWRGWEEFSGLGVLKVRSKTPSKRGRHWVVAESHTDFGYVIRDPASPLVSFLNPPMDVRYREFDMEPGGRWIRVGPRRADAGLGPIYPRSRLSA